MFFRILKLDLKKKKLMNILLLLFIILATVFSASGLNNIAAVLNGTDYYFQKAEMGDYAVFEGPTGNVAEILDKEEIVKSYKVEHAIFGNKCNLKHDDIALETSENIIFQSIDDICINLFDENDEQFNKINKGEVFLTGRALEKSNLSVGDDVIVEIGDFKKTFKIGGRVKDAFCGSDFMGVTRVLLNEDDYKDLYKKLYNEEYKEDNNHGHKIYYIETDHAEQMDKVLSDAKSILFKGDKDTLKLCYMMEMIVAFIVVVLSVCLVVVALLILRFTITFTVNEEYREIGVMKAIGINNRSIRNLYIVKYLTLAVVGGIIGFALSIPFGSMLIKSSTDNMVLGNTAGYTINIIGAAVVALITVLFACIYTGKVKKASPVDAIRNGQTGERYKSKTIYKLKNSHFRINMYMAINDILSAPKRFITIIISLFVCMVFVLGMVITTDTMKSDSLITTFFSKSDLYFVPGDSKATTLLLEEGSEEKFKEYIKAFEDKLNENGIPCEICIELMFNHSIEFNGESTSFKFLQGYNTTIDQYPFYEGITPVKENEIAIADKVSEKIGAKIGDTITVDFGTEKRDYIVTAYFKSLNNFGQVVRLNEYAPIFYDRIGGTGYFQINYKDNPSEEERLARQEKVKELLDTEDVYTGAETCAKTLGVTGTMEALQYFLLAVTIIIVILIVLLMELSFVTSEKSQIALLKAIGFKNIHIIKWHMYRFFIVALVAEVLGCIFALPVTNIWCTQIFNVMGLNEVNYVVNPVHVYLLYPGIVLGVTIVISWIAALVTNKVKSSDTANIE